MKLNLFGGFIRCSPLFIILCVLSIVSENTEVFLTYMGALMLHECAHYVMAVMLGCRVISLDLLPYGCRMEIIAMNSPWDELIIALGGPVCSLICCMGCRAIPMADEFAKANMYIAVTNLLPVYPLDGGRAVKAFLNMAGITAGRSIRAFSGFGLAVLMGILGYTVNNITLITFSIFLLSEAIIALNERGGSVLSHMKNMQCAASGRGINVRHIALRKDVSIRIALSYNHVGYAVFCILDDNLHEIARVDGVLLTELAAKHGSGTTLGDVIPFIDRSK